VRALATSLAVLAALLALPAGALATDQIRVEPEGSAARTVTLSGLGEPDVQAREYTVDDGTGERRVPITGYSLDRLLDAADVDPYRFADVQVAAAAGASATLDRSEVTRTGAFPDGPPVFWLEGGEGRFLRPGSAAGASVLVGGGAITVSLSRASELGVTASASPRRVKAGEPVTFTATVDGATAGEPVELNWYFDDGGQASGTRVTHRFRRPGTYDVLVGATTASDETGADHTISVQVGKARKGPNRKGGGTNPDANAPDSGAATGAAGGGSGSGGSGGSGGASGASEGAAADAGAAADERRRESARRRAARRRAAERREARRRAADQRERTEPGDGGGSRQVRGIELADLSSLTSQAGRDALRAARRGRLREDEESSAAGIPAAVWWTLGLAGLLGLGAWREARTGPAGRPA
jgi:PKD domain